MTSTQSQTYSTLPPPYTDRVGVTMIGNLYKCNNTRKIYVVHTAIDDYGGAFLVLHCTQEPYDSASMHTSIIEDFFTPIT